MRILHLDSGREMRGGQWQALRLHRGLFERGHQSLLLAPEGSPLAARAAECNVPCEPLRPLRLGMLSRGFDLVHAHDAHSHTLGALFSRVPLVVSRRVIFPVKRSFLSAAKYRRPALFLAVSNAVARQLGHAGIDSSRIAVVYDGVPVPDQPASGDAVLAPFSLDPAKASDLAREGAALAGVTLEFSHALDADLARARVLLYLSHSEGLGSAILLAMAWGVTVIASRTGGIPELIEDGVNGLLVPNEPGAVARAFERVDRRLGAAARQTVLDRFTVAHMIDSTLAAYHQVLRNA